MLWLILEFVFKIQWQLEIKELVSHKQAPSHEHTHLPIEEEHWG